MPRKIREIEAEYLRNGFWLVGGRANGKGSHRKFRHPLLPGSFGLAGQSGNDAKPYQERDLRDALAALRAAQRSAQ